MHVDFYSPLHQSKGSLRASLREGNNWKPLENHPHLCKGTHTDGDGWD